MPLVSAEHKSTAALAPKTSFVIDTLMLTAMRIISTLIDVCKNAKKKKLNKKIVSQKLICNTNKLLYLIITNICQKVDWLIFALVMISLVLKYGTALLDL